MTNLNFLGFSGDEGDGFHLVNHGLSKLELIL